MKSPIETRIIDARVLATKILDEVAAGVAHHVTAPGLAVVRVGEDPASAAYVAAKLRATARAGLRPIERHLPATVAVPDLIDLIADLNADPAIHGIIVQLRLPAHVSAKRVLADIAPGKDVDGFHVANAGRLARGLAGPVPRTALACLALLEDELGALGGLQAVVLGRSTIVGRPAAALLRREDCTVTIAH